MNKNKLTVGVEFEDKYENAKQDLLKARKSFMELNEIEQNRLLKEMFKAEELAWAIKVMQQYRDKR